MRVYGIDFSGAEQAGRAIWIAQGIYTPEALALDACVPAYELREGDSRRERTLELLRLLIRNAADSAIGMDFPFSLPATAIRQSSWVDFIRAFAKEYRTAEDFYQKCKTVGWRTTDKEAKTPFTVANLRLYKQTYYGIRDLLAPMVIGGKAVALPMQQIRPDVPWLLEICPASLLKRHNLYLSYKGKAPEKRENRAKILEAVEKMGLVIESAPLREKILDNRGGDALDSVLAAFITWQTLHDQSQLKPANALQTFEGRVYF